MSLVDYNDDGEWVTEDGRVVDVSFDWKASPSEVIEAVNAALKQHGLMLTEHDTESDCYAFTVDKT